MAVKLMYIPIYDKISMFRRIRLLLEISKVWRLVQTNYALQNFGDQSLMSRPSLNEAT